MPPFVIGFNATLPEPSSFNSLSISTKCWTQPVQRKLEFSLVKSEDALCSGCTQTHKQECDEVTTPAALTGGALPELAAVCTPILCFTCCAHSRINTNPPFSLMHISSLSCWTSLLYLCNENEFLFAECKVCPLCLKSFFMWPLLNHSSLLKSRYNTYNICDCLHTILVLVWFY